MTWEELKDKREKFQFIHDGEVRRLIGLFHDRKQAYYYMCDPQDSRYMKVVYISAEEIQELPSVVKELF